MVMIERNVRMDSDLDDVGISVTSLVKEYRSSSGEEVRALDDVDLQVRRGEILVLLGPSGCGKTTLLRCIAGLEEPSAGSVEFRSAGGRAERADGNVGMVFQNYALWPHMTVAENLAYPLQSTKRRNRMSRQQIAARVEELLSLMQLEGLGDRYPSQISGGQQQRVALGRAVASGNGVVLFDEPLSNIDAKVRERLRHDIVVMQRKLGFTAVYVTHDQHEAMDLADRIAVMSKGRIVQLDTPAEVYRRPSCEYVADFLGTSNILRGTRAEGTGPEVLVTTPIGEVAITDAGVDDDSLREGVVVGRAHDWTLSSGERSGPNTWSGVVESAAFLGAHFEYWIRVGTERIRVWADGDGHVDVTTGDTVTVAIEPRRLRFVPGGEVAPRAVPAAGGTADRRPAEALSAR
jgi:iron(III) transport system ATP-binding protein